MGKDLKRDEVEERNGNRSYQRLNPVEELFQRLTSIEGLDQPAND